MFIADLIESADMIWKFSFITQSQNAKFESIIELAPIVQKKQQQQKTENDINSNNN